MITAVEVLQQPFFRFRIQGRGTLVQDEYAALTQQGACDGDPLGLALAEAAAYLATRRFQPLRKVQARTSFGPAVRKLARPSVSYASATVRSSELSESP